MKIKCKIDCQVADCQDCANLLAESEKRLEQMMVFEKNRTVGLSDVGLYNCYVDVQKEKNLAEEKIKFYEQKLRERGLLSSKKEFNLPVREWDAWSC